MNVYNKKLLLVILISLIIVFLIVYFINNSLFPIDVVYTWAGENNSNNKRFSYNNELKYSLRSIFKFAPWVNHIYIYMNAPKKVPSWFNEQYKKKITIVDHTETILANYMPNTNSNAIETTLSEIPGLNEHFIYFNDDFFLTSPCKWSDFFTLTGKPYVSNKIVKTIPMSINGHNTKYPEFPYEIYQGTWPHIPLPRLKSGSKQFQNEFADYIEWVRKTTTRNTIGCSPCLKNKLHCPCQQQHYILSHYMYKKGVAALKNYDQPHIYTYMSSADIVKNKHVLDKVINNPKKYLCINDVDDAESKKYYFNKIILEFYEKIYPDKPYYEK